MVGIMIEITRVRGPCALRNSVGIRQVDCVNRWFTICSRKLWDTRQMNQYLKQYRYPLTAIAGLAGLLLSTSAPALEDGNKSLREAVRTNEIVSLESILSWIEDRYYGQIIEVELENQSGYFSYEVDLLSPTNSKIEFQFDARTGALLSVTGRDLEKAKRK